jgi:hypothetical protein
MAIVNLLREKFSGAYPTKLARRAVRRRGTDSDKDRLAWIEQRNHRAYYSYRAIKQDRASDRAFYTAGLQRLKAELEQWGIRLELPLD